MRAALFLSLVFLTACSSVDVRLRGGGPLEAMPAGGLAVAPAVVLAELPGAVKEDAFRESLFVGHLHMAGGYEVVETEVGMQRRSKEVTGSAEARYRTQARQWLDGVMAEAFARAAPRRVEVASEALALPVRREMRGSGEFDLRDNQNLPRFELDPQPLDDAQRSALGELSGATHLLVPFVVYYYSHNGGWFVGQSIGTGAGARIRVLWVVYELKSGAVARFGEAEARHLERYVMSPNSTQTEDYVLAVEKTLGKRLERELTR